MAVDADFSKVSLLLHCDGANGSTTFTDSSSAPKAQAVAASGVALSTAQSKFGGTSALFNGGYIFFGAIGDAALAPGLQDFCIEAWCYDMGGSSRRVLVGNSGANGGGDTITILLTAGNSFSVSVTADSVRYAIAPSTQTPLGVWYHLALVRVGTSVKLFLNGVAIGAAVGVVGSVTGGGGRFALGSLGEYLGYGGAYGAQWMGHVDDFRYTIGAPRYTADFTAPTEPFPNASAAYELSGTVTGSTGFPVARAIRAIREDTGAYVGGVISNATTGAYTIPTLYSGEHTVVAYPVTGDGLPALVHHGVIPV